MIEVRNVHKAYRTGAVPLLVLKGIQLKVAQGESVAITGPSGAGKSTLLHLLAGLDRPTSGDVRWEDRSLARMSDRELADFRNRTVGIVFQFYHLLPELTALENVMVPALIARRPRRAAVKDRAQACLASVGLRDRAAHTPAQLSGGELQRVAIARALMNEPKMVLCDEPTGNLDSRTGETIIELLIGVHRRQGMGLVVVTHEEAFAALMDRHLVLRDGQFVQTADIRPQTSVKGSALKSEV